MSTKDKADEQLKPFAATLQEIGGGKLAARLAAQFAELNRAVTTTGQKGSITIKIEVEHMKKADANTLVVTGVSTAKVPEGDEATARSVMFADPAGNLSRDDPRQQQLPLVGLPTQKAANA